MMDSRLVKAYFTLLRHDEWNVGIVHAPITTFLGSERHHKIDWLPSVGRGKFLADPFGVYRDGRLYILCEEFDYRTYKGKIVSIEVSPEGNVSKPRTAIDLPIHLSYPHLLEYRGEIYCIPESHEAREIALYLAEEFPYRWKKIRSLISEVPAVDATVFNYHERWWLTFSRSIEEGGPTELYVWHAPDLFGPWEPHAANPVKSDKSSSRPGGTPFFCDDILYRPAQDLSNMNRQRIVLNRILTLTPTEFDERPVSIVEPIRKSPYPDGLHTLSAAGNLTIIDAKRFRFVWSAFQRALRRGLSKASLTYSFY